MKETFYFQHDYNARNDPKLQDVLIDLGVEGIGVFWCIIEQLYEKGGTLPISSSKSIAFALHVDSEVVDKVVNNYGLFKHDDENMWSDSVFNRLNRRKNISDKRKIAALSRWQQGIENQPHTNNQSLNNPFIDDANASKNDANAMQMHPKTMQMHQNSMQMHQNSMQMQCKCNANASENNANASLVYPQLFKEKEKKVGKEKKKENIEEKENTPKGVKEKEKSETAKRFVPPTFEEAKARIVEMGYTFDAESFIAFYQSNGWMVGKSKMKDWKAAMVTWQKRENNFPRKISTKKANEEW